MSGIRKADTLEELSLDYFNKHYILEGRQKSLARLFRMANENCKSDIEWNTYEVYHVDTLLRDNKWRVQLRVKFNFYFDSPIQNNLMERFVNILDTANKTSFVDYKTVGYPHEEVMITLTCTIPFKD